MSFCGVIVYLFDFILTAFETKQPDHADLVESKIPVKRWAFGPLSHH
jgi:hypothetical protein